MSPTYTHVDQYGDELYVDATYFATIAIDPQCEEENETCVLLEGDHLSELAHWLDAKVFRNIQDHGEIGTDKYEVADKYGDKLEVLVAPTCVLFTIYPNTENDLGLMWQVETPLSVAADVANTLLVGLHSRK